jgi:site-specific DNA-cytosine methylase
VRVLVACEFSGVVRDAFLARGHDAWSCDILPTDVPGPHLEGDVFTYIGAGWDLMVAHPPCTYLTVAGNRWYADKPDLIGSAVDFVLALANCDIPRIAIENPVGRLSTLWRKPDQYIQPWMYGHKETKKTGLWLKGLPLLVPTNIVEGPYEQRIWKMAPSKDRAKLRSITYQGIADAMAAQWG